MGFFGLELLVCAVNGGAMWLFLGLPSWRCNTQGPVMLAALPAAPLVELEGAVGISAPDLQQHLDGVLEVTQCLPGDS